LKRPSPAATALIVAAALVVLADAAITLVPASRADEKPPTSPTPSYLVAAVPSATASILVYVPATDVSPLPSATDGIWINPDDLQSPSPTPAPTPKPRPTPAPTPVDTVWNARIYAKAVLGATQYDCIYQLFQVESKWDPQAGTPGGAYGIPQAFPGSKMASFGSNWRYSPLTQVKWGIWYVNSRYGSACAAWSFWQAHGWY